MTTSSVHRPVAVPRAALQRPPGSNARRFAVLGMAALLLLVVFVGSIALGAVRLSPGEVVDGLFGAPDGVAGQIVQNVRLPRAFLALAVGAALALAGYLLQDVTRNPLADPQILGFSSAAALAAVLASVNNPDLPAAVLPAIASAGALAGAVLVFAAAWGTSASPVRIALAGVMLASLFTSFTALLLVTSDLTTQAALTWVAGGLFGRGWDHWHAAWPYLLVTSALALLMVRQLNILSLGDDHARSLGLDVQRSRVLAVIIAALLTGAAVSVAGQIAFVGLVAPHAARMMVGSDSRYSLPLAALGGAILLGVSDILSRLLIAPTEIPIGVVTAAIGVPFFLFLLRTRT